MTIARKPLHRMQLATTGELCQALGGGHDLGAHVALHHFQRGVTQVGVDVRHRIRGTTTVKWRT